jgi:hypothetical protein
MQKSKKGIQAYIRTKTQNEAFEIKAYGFQFQKQISSKLNQIDPIILAKGIVKYGTIKRCR